MQPVVANCSVLMLARDNYATVTKYNCDTRQGQLMLHRTRDLREALDEKLGLLLTKALRN